MTFWGGSLVPSWRPFCGTQGQEFFSAFASRREGEPRPSGKKRRALEPVLIQGQSERRQGVRGTDYSPTPTEEEKKKKRGGKGSHCPGRSGFEFENGAKPSLLRQKGKKKRKTQALAALKEKQHGLANALPRVSEGSQHGLWERGGIMPWEKKTDILRIEGSKFAKPLPREEKRTLKCSVSE